MHLMPVAFPEKKDEPNSCSNQHLARIVSAVQTRVQQRKGSVPLSDLQRACLSAKQRPSFRHALEGLEVSLIAEVKRASPSAGPIRLDLDVSSTVQAYEEAGARAVSVLTEQDFFAGSPEDLIQAAQSTSLPILRKDFVIDVYQVYEAKAWGASAVLLIAAVLNDEELRRFSRVAYDLGLDVLIEAHDKAELMRALAVDGAIVGINNRDLRTFEVSLSTSLELSHLVPPGRLLVAESGIRHRGDVERLAAAGVDAILVGEALLRASDVRHAVGVLLEPKSVKAPRRLCRPGRGEVL